jgi:predicted transcriptional regulator
MIGWETGCAAPLPGLDQVPQRIRQLAMLRGLGYSFREIGKQLGVSPQAVSLMLSRHRRAFKSLSQAMELGNLSARAVNALGRHGISNRDEARQRRVLDLLKDERNCGRKTLDEITRWMDEKAGMDANVTLQLV